MGNYGEEAMGQLVSQRPKLIDTEAASRVRRRERIRGCALDRGYERISGSVGPTDNDARPNGFNATPPNPQLRYSARNWELDELVQVRPSLGRQLLFE